MFFQRLLAMFSDLGSILGGSGASKIKKIAENRFRGAFGARLDLRYDFGSDLAIIFADVWWILGGFPRTFDRLFKTGL